jgi:TolB-like protein
MDCERSYIRIGGRIRVTAQLIDATTINTAGRSYDRTQHDMLVIQAEVATAIARDVGQGLHPAMNSDAEGIVNDRVRTRG